jgi:hypothetical protein
VNTKYRPNPYLRPETFVGANNYSPLLKIKLKILGGIKSGKKKAREALPPSGPLPG